MTSSIHGRRSDSQLYSGKTGSGIKTILLLFICLLGGAVPALAEVPMQLGLTTRDAGKTLNNDLTFVKGKHPGAPGVYPKAAVVKWGPVPADVSGRYRITMRARIEKFGASTLAMEAWVPEENGGLAQGTLEGGSNTDSSRILLSTFVMKGLAYSYKRIGAMFEQPGTWQEITYEFDVEKGTPLMAGLLYYPASNAPLGMLELEKASLRLEKVDKPLFLSWARPKKIRYKHNEKGILEVRICNAGTRAENVRVRPVLINDEDERVTEEGVEFDVPAGGMIEGAVPFRIPADDGGYEITGELLKDGNVVDRRGDVCAVTDSAFEFMTISDTFVPYYLWHAFNLGLLGFKETVHDNWEEYVRICKVAVEIDRRKYSTYCEFFSWAREDATILKEESDEPYLAGQSQYPISRKQIRLLGDLFREHGIAVTAYINACPFGWPGFEVLRRRPEWLLDDGEILFNTRDLENYFRMMANPGRSVTPAVIPAIEVEFNRESPIDGRTYYDHHTEQMEASTEDYGWEAWRYDASPLPTHVFPRVKRFLAGLNPPVEIGNNQGIHCMGDQPNHEWKVYCKDGSLMMEEDTRAPFAHEKDKNRLWKDWIPYVRLGSHLSRSNGGHYTFIGSRDNWYASALGYAAGGHPWQFVKNPFGENEKFMLHYGSVFWDLRTQMMPSAEVKKAVEIKSDRPLWTEGLVSERVLGGKRRQVIVSFVNPPAEAEVTGSTFVAPADGVTVTFIPRAGEDVTAWLLAPEPEPHREELTVTKLGGRKLKVEIPRFWIWSNVVFDCKGGE